MSPLSAKEWPGSGRLQGRHRKLLRDRQRAWQMVHLRCDHGCCRSCIKDRKSEGIGKQVAGHRFPSGLRLATQRPFVLGCVVQYNQTANRPALQETHSDSSNFDESLWVINAHADCSKGAAGGGCSGVAQGSRQGLGLAEVRRGSARYSAGWSGRACILQSPSSHEPARAGQESFLALAKQPFLALAGTRSLDYLPLSDG